MGICQVLPQDMKLDIWIKWVHSLLYEVRYLADVSLCVVYCGQLMPTCPFITEEMMTYALQGN